MQKLIVKENRKFGFLVGGTLIFISSYSYFKNAHNLLIPLAGGIILILLSMLVPKSLTQVRIIWEKLGHFLGQVNTIFVLTSLYILIVIPIGVINRILGKDILNIKMDPDGESYWEIINDEEPINLNQQF